jgi:hypothetical protein
MQARPAEVVAALALHEVIVSEEQVRAVLMEMLKQLGVRRSQSFMPVKQIRRPQKVIPGKARRDRQAGR